MTAASEASAEDVCWDFDEPHLLEQVLVDGEDSDSGSASSEGLYSNVAQSDGDLFPQSAIYENGGIEDEASNAVYENTGLLEPVYENCMAAVSDDSDDCDEDHIYEHVYHQPQPSSPDGAPVNVFLTFLQDRAETISPDPNIYEIPPGAIINYQPQLHENQATNLLPPEGYQDYENLCWKKEQRNLGLNKEVEAVYSTVVKPKRKKIRPTLSDMLHKEQDQLPIDKATKTIAGLEDSSLVIGKMEKNTMNTNCEEGSNTLGNSVNSKNVDTCDTVIYANGMNLNNIDQCNMFIPCVDAPKQNETIDVSEVSMSEETGELTEPSNVYENIIVSNNNEYVNIVFSDGISSNTDIPSQEVMTEKQTESTKTIKEEMHNIVPIVASETNNVNADLVALEEPISTEVVEDTTLKVEGELAPVIEISDDGTWETKALTEADMEQVKQNELDDANDNAVFLNSNGQSPETVKIRHVALAYGSQYYVNCPVASVKPMPHENCIVPETEPEPKAQSRTAEDDVDVHRNIGAQIMKKYEQERQKMRESRNLPDVSLLDVDASLEDIERERRRIIENQAVRAKRIDSWIKNGKHPEEMFDDQLDIIHVSPVLNNEQRIDSWIKSGDFPNGLLGDVQQKNTQTQVELPVPNVTEEESSTTKSEDTTVLHYPLSADSILSSKCVLKQSDPMTDKETELDDVSSPKILADGEVVYDSILQNKHKTKNYWEQLMMAAATSEQPKVQYHTMNNKRDLLSLGSDAEDGKPNSDVSEQEYYDAQSQISLHSPAEPLDSLDQTECSEKDPAVGPKIVETVAKKLAEAESVIEREIRLQREREAALALERETALQASQASLGKAAEAKIALELREMREREDELRRLRQRYSSPKEYGDDGFNSIPNTDEGNFSEYGSEEKELSLDGNNSRMMSPEVPTQGGFSHQRTQSLDSMSSGHSSGSGGNTDFYPNRRRVVVKPLDEPEEEEVPTYMRSSRIATSGVPGVEHMDPSIRIQKETPIEREIRLTREREEELRREKGLPPNMSSTPTKQEVRRVANRNLLNSNDSRSVQHRLATSRIQQEINEATAREKELRAAGMIQTTSEDTVDSKVTRFTDLAEYAIEERDRKLQKSISTSNIPTSVLTETDGGVSTVPPPSRKLQLRSPVGRPVASALISSISPSKRFSPAIGHKGLMQRFLASHGKVNTISSNWNSSTPPQTSPIPTMPPVYTPPSVPKKQSIEVTPILENQTTESEELTRTPVRRGYQSAEEKIQVELQEMQKREEELRLQRARMFAQSQPNLLCIITDDEEDDANRLNGNLEKPMALRSTLSNPNLLDSEDSTPMGDSDSSLDKPSHRNARKRSALIAEWENRIQKNIDN